MIIPLNSLKIKRVIPILNMTKIQMTRTVTSKLCLILIFQILFFPKPQAATIMGFCFEENVSLNNVENSLSAITHVDDQIFKRSANNCIEVKGNASRANLYELYLNKKYNVMRTYGTGSVNSGISSAPACNLNIKKSSRKNSVTESLALGKKNNLIKKQSKKNSITNSQLLVDSGRTGTISVDQFRIRIKCINLIRSYKLEIDLEHNTGGVSTSITIRPGQELDLGSIVDDLNNQGQTISLKEGFKKSKTTSKVQSNYTITIK